MVNLHATLWRFRYILIAATAIGILASILSAIERLEPEMAAVVVVKNSVPAGTELSASDLEIRLLPTDALPEGSLTEPREATGQVVATNLPAGMPLARSTLLGEEFLATAGSGQAIVPVHVAMDGTDAVAVPGARIALYSLPSGYEEAREAKLVTGHAIVVGLGATDSGSSIFREAESTRVVFVSIPQEEANAVLGYGAVAPMRAVIIDPA
ncbi:flagellar basal body P-ring biosynthesis protein FlgA [Actinobaculum suis]|uniref:Flagellar basal body P-ring biosynthesis protein FlgA n=1 Tax=Actinobaculum suis TaxID=1657 RepID=A0A7Z9CA91_9ACTO|nr:SAF domain-containing protein [Actinobaculum suis]VDG77041.1 flagellar basal body P-ring biosynthesis protein FlgA [Actinobaculum suis]